MDRFVRDNPPEGMISTADAVMKLYDRLTIPIAQSFEESLNRMQSAPETIVRDAIINGALSVHIFDANGTKRRLSVEHWQRWCSDSVRSVSIGVFIGQSIGNQKETEKQTCHGVSIYFDDADWKKWLQKRPVASANEMRNWVQDFQANNPKANKKDMEKAAIARFGSGQRDSVGEYWAKKKSGRSRKPRQVSRQN